MERSTAQACSWSCSRDVARAPRPRRAASDPTMHPKAAAAVAERRGAGHTPTGQVAATREGGRENERTGGGSLPGHECATGERESLLYRLPLSLSLPSVPRNSRTFTSPPSPSLSESIPRKSHSERAAAPPIAVERSAEGGGAGAGGGERGHAPRATAAHSVARRSRGGGASERASVRGSRVRAL